MTADRPRRLPRLIGLAIRIAWRAAPREVVGLVAAQVSGMAAIVGALLLGRHLLSIGVDASRGGAGLNNAVPTALLLTAATGVIGITRAVAMRNFGDGSYIFDGAEKVRRLDDHAGGIVGNRRSQFREAGSPITAKSDGKHRQ